MQRQQEGLEAAERVLVAAATRQEKVYCEVIRSQREKMERLEKVIAEVDGEVGGASPNSGYVNGQKQLHSLQVSVGHFNDTLLCSCVSGRVYMPDIPGQKWMSDHLVF